MSTEQIKEAAIKSTEQIKEAAEVIMSTSSSAADVIMSSPMVMAAVSSPVVASAMEASSSAAASILSSDAVANSTDAALAVAAISADAALAVAASPCWRDQRWWYTGAGIALGAYFGYRVGAASQRARRFVANIPKMRAAVCNSYDGIQSVVVQDVESPIIVNDTDVLIEVKAASLDPMDIKVCQGVGRGLRSLVNKYNPNVSTTDFPVILGRDGTGLVSAVGSEVTGLEVGDRVWFVVPPCVQGSMSHFIVLNQDLIKKLPETLTFESGATLPYCGMVAWDMLVTSGGLGPQSKGKSVFIWGGVRALERLAIQLCHEWGCQVTCVAPRYCHEYLANLGADIVLQDLISEVTKLVAQGTTYDLVVNTAGLIAEDLCLSLARDTGRVVTMMTAAPGLRECGLYTGIIASFVNTVMDIISDNVIGTSRKWRNVRLDGEVLEYLGELVEKGKLDPVGERIYSLEQAEIAFRALAAGGHRGKLVLRMEDLSKVRALA